MTALTLDQWGDLLPQARAAGLLGHLGARLEALALLDSLPPPVRDHLRAGMTVAAECHRAIRWEVDRIRRALAHVRAPIVLLKGAAYVMADLPVARGRVFSDVDVLVPRDALGAIEAALLRHGWEPVTLDPYDQRYYRSWMHELPPLRHRRRRTVVDVHHAILPATARVRPDAAALLRAALPLERERFGVLAPADMVLHGAAHLFQDGSVRSGLRDLCDLDSMLRHFGAEPGFWDALFRRARRLDLGRSLFHAVRQCGRLLGTPAPPGLVGDLAAFRPRGPALRLMDWLVSRAWEPHAPAAPPPGARLARRALYVRSHWLRMPPHLLAPHLLRKGLVRRAHGARPA